MTSKVNGATETQKFFTFEEDSCMNQGICKLFFDILNEFIQCIKNGINYIISCFYQPEVNKEVLNEKERVIVDLTQKNEHSRKKSEELAATVEQLQKQNAELRGNAAPVKTENDAPTGIITATVEQVIEHVSPPRSPRAAQEVPHTNLRSPLGALNLNVMGSPVGGLGALVNNKGKTQKSPGMGAVKRAEQVGSPVGPMAGLFKPQKKMPFIRPEAAPQASIMDR